MARHQAAAVMIGVLLPTSRFALVPD